MVQNNHVVGRPDAEMYVAGWEACWYPYGIKRLNRDSPQHFQPHGEIAGVALRAEVTHGSAKAAL